MSHILHLFCTLAATNVSLLENYVNYPSEYKCRLAAMLASGESELPLVRVRVVEIVEGKGNVQVVRSQISHIYSGRNAINGQQFLDHAINDGSDFGISARPHFKQGEFTIAH